MFQLTTAAPESNSKLGLVRISVAGADQEVMGKKNIAANAAIFVSRNFNKGSLAGSFDRKAVCYGPLNAGSVLRAVLLWHNHSTSGSYLGAAPLQF